MVLFDLRSKLDPVLGVKSQIFAISAIFQLNISKFERTVNCSDIISTVCSPFNSEQNKVSLRFLGGIYVTQSIPEGNSVTVLAKSPGGKLGQWPWLASDRVEALSTCPCKKIDPSGTSSSSGPQETTKPAKLASIGIYGASQGQWPRMTYWRSLCNDKGHIWSCVDLIHAWCLYSSQW